LNPFRKSPCDRFSRIWRLAKRDMTAVFSQEYRETNQNSNQCHLETCVRALAATHRESGPEVVQEPVGVAASPTLLGPVLVWSQGSYQRLLFRVLLGLPPPRPSPEEKRARKWMSFVLRPVTVRLSIHGYHKVDQFDGCRDWSDTTFLNYSGDSSAAAWTQPLSLEICIVARSMVRVNAYLLEMYSWRGDAVVAN